MRSLKMLVALGRPERPMGCIDITFLHCLLWAMLIGQLAGAQTQDSTDHHGDVAGVLLQAGIRRNAGRNSEARSILQQALSKAPESPALLNALGSLEQDRGEYFKAEQAYLRALGAPAEKIGDTQRIFILNNLATLYLDTDQYSKGERVREELEKMPARALESDPAAAALLLNVMASLEHARHKDDKAISYYTKALALLGEAQGPMSANVAAVESNLGYLHLEAGRCEEASVFFRNAIQKIETLGKNDAALVQPLINLARCENLGGHGREAESLTLRAIEISTSAFGGQHPITAKATLERASALRKLGRPREARTLEKQAQTSLRKTSAANLSGYTVGFRDLAKAK
jgi:tetratricopeptide (TPR) repeat protein